MAKRFLLFVAQTGSVPAQARPGAGPFACGGWLVEEALLPHLAATFHSLIAAHPALSRPLSAADLQARKQAHRPLGRLPEAEQTQLREAIGQLLATAPGWLTGCVVEPQPAPNEATDLHRVAFHILLERSVKLALAMGGELRVVAPRWGRREEHLLQAVYRELKAQGQSFDPARPAAYESLRTDAYRALNALAFHIPASSLRQHGGGLELAQLATRAIARGMTTHPEDAHLALLQAHRKLSDAWAKSLGDPGLGIKLYRQRKQAGAAEAAPVAGHQEGRPLG